MKRVVLAFVAVSAASCHRAPTLRAQWITGDAFAIVGDNQDLLSRRNLGVERVARDGRTVWHVDDLDGEWLLPRTDNGAAWIIGRQPSGTTLTTIDVQSGKKVGSVVLPWGIGKFVRSGEGLFDVSSGVRRLDPKDGSIMWEARAQSAAAFAESQTLVTDEFVFLQCDVGLCAFRTKDGAQQYTLEIEASAPRAATPDGRSFLRVHGGKLISTNAESRKTEWQIDVPKGRVATKLAASDQWIAMLSVSSGDNQTSMLSILRRSDGKRVWNRESSRNTYFEYVAAGSPFVVYFDSADASVHAVAVPQGVDAPIHKLREVGVFSEHASGAAPAVPSASPETLGNVVIVHELTPVGEAGRAYELTLVGASR